MLKETGYQEKFEILRLWLVDIVEAVKKDLKNEHLKIDREFCKRYFMGKNIAQISVQELAEAYHLDIKAGNVGLGEFIASRWLLKNTDLYGFFEEKLRSVHPEFEQIDELNDTFSLELMQESTKRFGGTRTYLFAVLNSVVFPQAIYDELRRMAEKETSAARKSIEEKESAETLKESQKRYEREIAALTDRYEKKISGFQKKYLQDMEMMKKQISQLQKKLTEAST